MMAVLIALLCLHAAGVLAEVSMQADVGYEGTIFNGRWYPLRIEMTNKGAALDGVLSVELWQDEAQKDRYEYPVSLKAGETKTIAMPMSTLVLQWTYEVSLQTDGQEVARATADAVRQIDNTTLIIGALGLDAQAAKSMNITRNADVLRRGETMEAVNLSEESFPESERELAAFDALAIDAFDVSRLSEVQQKLLENWLETGGIVILGPGQKNANAQAWFAERTGISFGGAERVAGVAGALMDYVDAAAETALEESWGYPLRVQAGQALAADDAGRCLLAQADCGTGSVIACGFSLGDASVCSAAKESALWQRLLLTAVPELYLQATQNHYRQNTQINSYLNQLQKVSTGESILPAALVLAAYVLIAGIGLPVLCRRRDHSMKLWVLLPGAALAGMLLVFGLSACLGLNGPTAASLHVTAYDATGRATSEEVALVGFGDQTRVTLSGSNGETIEKAENAYFYSGSYQDEDAVLDSRVTLGESPALEVSAAAPWVTRSLVIGNSNLPEGALRVSAVMEEDGLHAEICNDTDLELKNAVLLSNLGYIRLGDIAAGETREAILERKLPVSSTKNGQQLILSGTMLEFPPSSEYSVYEACVYPESQTQENFSEEMLDEAEQEARQIEMAKLSSVSYGSNSIGCILFADCPQIGCAPLYKDGERIERTAQTSVVIAEADFRMISDSGHFYYPLGTIAPHMASLTDGCLELGEEVEDFYVALSEEVLFGYDVSQVEGEIECIRLIGQIYQSAGGSASMEIYDRAIGDWVRLGTPGTVTLAGDLLRRAISEQGQIFLRYTMSFESASGKIPSIIVEGSSALEGRVQL